MEFITIVRNKQPITIAIESIVSFKDEDGDKSKIILTTGDCVITNTAIGSKLTKYLRMRGHDVVNLENIKC